ncbi:21367_t:CDS:2 [Dentiscutata erythropus]|uniref:21367_t:CDS:1 n=1 Tax=Dentiscutata erythropus TaxID=1348616 RepID=A0A9N9DKT0_9GLOM|nr:21367_t:CDS:2 [Dentiscutata erythropus]
MDAEEESFVKLLKLNHCFYYKNRNFVPSDRIVDGGKLTLEKYTGDLLVYQRIPNDVVSSKTTWELFEKAFSALIDKSQNTRETNSNFSENDVKLLIPILEITYVTTSVQSTSVGEFLFEKVLVGGALVIKNISEYSDDSLNQLKARIAWTINEFRWGHKNLFREAGELHWDHKNSSKEEKIVSIEDLSGNQLNDMKSLGKYIQQLYEFETSSVIAYEKVVPSYARFDAKKQQEIDLSKSCPDYFDKRLVPDISIYHTEIFMKDWLGKDNIYIQIPKWVKQYQLNHGLVINPTVLIPSVKPAIELISEPSIKFIDSPKMLNISYVATQKDLFHKTNYADIFSNSQSLLDSIPFVNFPIDTSPVNVIQCDIIYQQIQLTIIENEIKISNQLETAVTEALKTDNPYQEFEEIFKEYGQVFCLSFVMGERLSKLSGFSYIEQENLAKIISNEFKEITNCQNVFNEWKNFLSRFNMDSTRFDLPNGNSTVDINDINDIDLRLRTVPENPNSWKVINRLQLIPMYKLLNDDLQKEIEILLSNEEKILMYGVSKLENNKIRYYNVNFGFHLKSENYKIIGSIISNKLKRLDLDVRFQMLTVSGFSIIIDNKEMSKETADNDLMVHWLLIGNPLSVKYFSKTTRNMQILAGTISIILSNKQNIYVIDVKEEMDKVGLPSLSPDCIILHTFEFLVPNFNLKFQATLKSWTKTKISLEVTNYSFEEINSMLEDEALGSLIQNSCNLAWKLSQKR